MQQETLDLLNRVVRDLRTVTSMVRDDTNADLALNDHIKLIIHYDQVRMIADQIKEAREALDEIKERLSKEQVPDVMRAHKVKTITVEGVGRVTISNRFSCTILDKERGFAYLRENGAGSLITETVNAQTLAAHARTLMEDDGIELPADIFKTGTSPYTSITKAK